MIPFFRKKQESEDYIEYAESHIESEPNIQSADHTQELVAMAEVIAKLKVEIEDWKRSSNEYCKKLFELQKKISDGASDRDLLNEMDVERLSPVVVNRYIENLAVKHSIVEDDNYCRIISQQDIFTISIRR